MNNMRHNNITACDMPHNVQRGSYRTRRATCRLDAPPTIGEDSKGAASTLRNRLKNAARIPVRHDSDGM